MRKILGTKDQYYEQTKNAQVSLIKMYTGQIRSIACGPTCAAMALDICCYDMSVFTPGEQPEDSLLMIFHNPAHLQKFKKTRDLDYNKYPPNEIPQLYPTVMEIIYKESVCEFSFGLSYEEIRQTICNDSPVQIVGKFPAGGHYVLVVGFDDKDKTLIYNDPYALQWPDHNGYNRIMDQKFFNKNIQKHKIIYYPQ